MDWHHRLNSSLADRGWNKAELSKRSGVSYSNLLKYCAGKVSHPRGPVIDQLAAALDIDPVWLLTGKTGANAENTPSPSNMSEQQHAFDLAVRVADRWEAELFGKANIVAHTTLVTHLYHYIIRNNIRSEDEVNSADTFAFG